MKTALAVLALAGLCGCSSVPQSNAVRDAVQNGRIAGIAPTLRFTTMPWCFPALRLGPYSETASFPGWMANDPRQHQPFIFFAGKRVTTKQWEIYAALAWTNGTWQTLPVDLPKPDATE